MEVDDPGRIRDQTVIAAGGRNCTAVSDVSKAHEPRLPYRRCRQNSRKKDPYDPQLWRGGHGRGPHSHSNHSELGAGGKAYLGTTAVRTSRPGGRFPGGDCNSGEGIKSNDL